jgi:2-dehydropantoate 2-reductase
MTRVLVVGCGAIGSLFAAAAAQAEGVEVWAYDAWGEHVEKINRDGLRLTGAGEAHVRLHATTEAAAIPPCELAIVATKAMHTASAVASCAGALSDAAVCSVQNGVGNEEDVAPHVPRVIRGTTFPAGHVIAPGLIGWDTRGDTHIGPFEPKPARAEEVERLAAILSEGGMPTHALADARPPQWTKVIFNAASNAIGGLTGLAHGWICEYEPTRELARQVMAEGRAVAAAMGIELERDPDELFDHGGKVAYDHKPSLLQDVLARRPTEIDAMNGGISRFGREHGVATPLNDALTALVKGLERSWLKTPTA